MKSVADLSTVKIGTGSPTLQYHGKYSQLFATLAPGQFLQLETRQDVTDMYNALCWHAQRHHPNWRIVQRMKELRVYVTERQS